MGDYLRFRDVTPEGRKTKIIRVVSYRGDILGEIKWYGGWRQYVFVPAASCLFNPDCMEEICRVIKNLMEERKR